MGLETRLGITYSQDMSQDSIINQKRKHELRKYLLLIRCRIIGQDEGAVVCPNVGDVAVLSTTEFGIVVARLRTFGNQRRSLWVKSQGKKRLWGTK